MHVHLLCSAHVIAIHLKAPSTANWMSMRCGIQGDTCKSVRLYLVLYSMLGVKYYVNNSYYCCVILLPWLLSSSEQRSYPAPHSKTLQVGGRPHRPSHIPSYLPSLPDHYTHIKTPVSCATSQCHNNCVVVFIRYSRLPRLITTL